MKAIQEIRRQNETGCLTDRERERQKGLIVTLARQIIWMTLRGKRGVYGPD
jgi:hypothetical protein